MEILFPEEFTHQEFVHDARFQPEHMLNLYIKSVSNHSVWDKRDMLDLSFVYRKQSIWKNHDWQGDALLWLLLIILVFYEMLVRSFIRRLSSGV